MNWLEEICKDILKEEARTKRKPEIHASELMIDYIEEVCKPYKKEENMKNAKIMCLYGAPLILDERVRTYMVTS